MIMSVVSQIALVLTPKGYSQVITVCQVWSVYKAKIWPPLPVTLRSPVRNDDAFFTPHTREPHRRKECPTGCLSARGAN